MTSFSLLTKQSFRWILAVLLGTIFADVIAYFLIDSPIIMNFFKITTEKNWPTLVSTLQLILSGSMLYALYKESLRSNVEVLICRYWRILAFIFFILAFDEWFTIHDLLGHAFSNHMGTLGTMFGWTLLYMIIMVVFFIWSLRFLIYLPFKTAIGMVVSGSIFLIGAIGFELLNTEEFKQGLGLDFSAGVAYIFGLVEESCEMLGIWLFNVTLFYYGNRTFESMVFEIPKRLYIGFFGFGLLDIFVTIIARLFN